MVTHHSHSRDTEKGSRKERNYSIYESKNPHTEVCARYVKEVQRPKLRNRPRISFFWVPLWQHQLKLFLLLHHSITTFSWEFATGNLGWRNFFNRFCTLRTHSWQSKAFWQQLTITPPYNEGKECNKAVKWLPKTTENAGSREELRFPVPSMLCQTEITTLPSNTELFNLTNKEEEQKHIHLEPGKYHCSSLVLRKSY